MKTDMEIIAEQCAAIDLLNGREPLGRSEWIACKDRLPDDARDVLTFGRYGVHRACFELGSEDDPCWWSDEVRKADFKESVTYWAELLNGKDQAR